MTSKRPRLINRTDFQRLLEHLKEEEEEEEEELEVKQGKRNNKGKGTPLWLANSEDKIEILRLAAGGPKYYAVNQEYALAKTTTRSAAGGTAATLHVLLKKNSRKKNDCINNHPIAVPLEFLHGILEVYFNLFIQSMYYEQHDDGRDSSDKKLLDEFFFPWFRVHFYTSHVGLVKGKMFVVGSSSEKEEEGGASTVVTNIHDNNNNPNPNNNSSKNNKNNGDGGSFAHIHSESFLRRERDFLRNVGRILKDRGVALVVQQSPASLLSSTMIPVAAAASAAAAHPEHQQTQALLLSSSAMVPYQQQQQQHGINSRALLVGPYYAAQQQQKQQQQQMLLQGAAAFGSFHSTSTTTASMMPALIPPPPTTMNQLVGVVVPPLSSMPQQQPQLLQLQQPQQQLPLLALAAAKQNGNNNNNVHFHYHAPPKNSYSIENNDDDDDDGRHRNAEAARIGAESALETFKTSQAPALEELKAGQKILKEGQDTILAVVIKTRKELEEWVSSKLAEVAKADGAPILDGMTGAITSVSTDGYCCAPSNRNPTTLAATEKSSSSPTVLTPTLVEEGPPEEELVAEMARRRIREKVARDSEEAQLKEFGDQLLEALLLAEREDGGGDDDNIGYSSPDEDEERDDATCNEDAVETERSPGGDDDDDDDFNAQYDFDSGSGSNVHHLATVLASPATKAFSGSYEKLPGTRPMTGTVGLALFAAKGGNGTLYRVDGKAAVWEYSDQKEWTTYGTLDPEYCDSARIVQRDGSPYVEHYTRDGSLVRSAKLALDQYPNFPNFFLSPQKSDKKNYEFDPTMVVIRTLRNDGRGFGDFRYDFWEGDDANELLQVVRYVVGKQA